MKKTISNWKVSVEIEDKIMDKIYEMSEDQNISAEQQLAIKKVFEEVACIINSEKLRRIR